MKTLDIPTPRYSILEGELTLTENDIRHLGAFADSTRRRAESKPKKLIPEASKVFGRDYKNGSAVLRAMKTSKVFPVLHSGNEEGLWFIEPEVDGEVLEDGVWVDAFNFRTDRMLCKSEPAAESSSVFGSAIAFTANFREPGTQAIEVVRTEIVTEPDILRSVLHAEFVARAAA